MSDKDDAATAAPAEAVREQLERMLVSATFREAQRPSRLLRYIVEEALAGRAANLKEYTLGVDVLERGAAYDPRVDPTVRVEISRLRSRIDLYYANDGTADVVRIVLPKGTYVPQFESRQPQSQQPIASTAEAPHGVAVWRWVAVAGAAVVTLGGWIVLHQRDDAQQIANTPFMQLEIDAAPEGAYIGSDVGADMALTPDGRQLVFVARHPEDGSHLHVRDLSGRVTRQLPGTFGARTPFISPDGQWVGFHAEGVLKKTRIDGLQDPVAIAPIVGLLGAAWGSDGSILVTLIQPELLSVDAASGKTRSMLRAAPTERFLWAQWVSHDAVLFARRSGTPGESWIDVLIPSTGERRALVRGGLFPRYLPGGYLTYLQGSRLFAQRFDAKSLTVSGAAVPLLDDVMYSPVYGYGQVTFSDADVLAYRRQGEAGLSRLQVLTPDGGVRALLAAPGQYQWPRVSPDGRQVAFMLREAQNYDLWTVDVHSGARTRIAAHGFDLFSPVWTPDSSAIVYSAVDGMRWVSASGGQQGKLLAMDGHPARIPRNFSADGRTLSFYAMDGKQNGTHFDLWTVPITTSTAGIASGNPAAYRRTRAVETYGALSPDGRWMTYTSDETGKYQVHVRAVPDDGRLWSVPDGSARAAVWSPKTGELLYRTDDQLVRAVTYRATGVSFSMGPSRVWSPVRLVDTGVVANFDVFPDGRGVAALTPVEGAAAPRDPLVIVTGIRGEIERRLAMATSLTKSTL